MDEHGTAIGWYTNHQVLADAQKRRTYKTEAGDRKWVTVIECVSTQGLYTRPMAIFKGKHLQST